MSKRPHTKKPPIFDDGRFSIVIRVITLSGHNPGFLGTMPHNHAIIPTNQGSNPQYNKIRSPQAPQVTTLITMRLLNVQVEYGIQLH
jgi:hypothetical protein